MKRIMSLALAMAACLMLVSCGMLRPAEPEEASSISTSAPYVSAAETSGITSEWLTLPPETDTAPVTVPPVIPTPEPGAPKHIVIDAGHGYTDPGCTTDFLDGKYEREIVGEFALELKAALEAKGYAVTLLRDDAKYVTAKEIAAAADAVGLKYYADKLVEDGRFAAYNRAVWTNVLHREKYVDAYISLHIDSYGGPEEVRGTRIYYCSENDFSAKSEKLCASFTDRLGHHLPDMRPRYFATGWEDGFAVTKHVQMPSALVEIGFATNEIDAANILDPEWRKTFSAALAEGFVQFFS